MRNLVLYFQTLEVKLLGIKKVCAYREFDKLSNIKTDSGGLGPSYAPLGLLFFILKLILFKLNLKFILLFAL